VRALVWYRGSAPRARAGAPRRRTAGRVAAVAAVLALGIVGGLALNRLRGTSGPPVFRQLTFRNGHVESARFALDGQTVVYAAYWDGRPIEIFLGRSEGPDFRPVGIPGADILAVSKSGEMALSLNRHWYEPFKLIGTLARVGVASSGAPREVLEDVFWADWSPDGRDLAIVRQVGGRSRLEFPIGKVLYEEKAGYLSHPRVSRDGQRVAFLEHPAIADDAGGVSVVDWAGRRTALVTGFAAVWGLAWSADGKEVWFTGAPTGIARAIYAVDLDGRRRAVARVAGSIRLDDVAPSGRVLLTHEHIKQRLVALGPGQPRERDLSWLDYSLAEAISPDGGSVLFVESGEGGGPGYSAFLRRTDGSPAIRLGEGTPLSFSPDGKKVLALVEIASAPRFMLYPIGPGEPQPLANAGLRVIGGDFMPDGQRILFWAREERHGVRLYVQDLAGGPPRAISPEGFWGYAGGISPDGRFVVVVGPNDGLFLYPIEGGEPRALATLTEDDSPGGWTPDGRYLYVIGAGGRPRKVDRLEIATGRREPWKELTPDDPEGSATAIRLTPDGRHYAYTYRRDESDLYLADGLR
jgi:Tol biopolymer transport system component